MNFTKKKFDKLFEDLKNKKKLEQKQFFQHETPNIFM